MVHHLIYLNMRNLGGGVWEIVIPQGIKSIDYSNLKWLFHQI